MGGIYLHELSDLMDSFLTVLVLLLCHVCAAYYAVHLHSIVSLKNISVLLSTRLRSHKWSRADTFPLVSFPGIQH